MNQLKLPKKSVSPIFMIICASLIIVASIIMSFLFTRILAISSAFYVYGAILLIILTATLAKREAKVLYAPLAIFAFPLINSWTFGIISLYYIVGYLAVAALTVLTVNKVIKSKLPAIITFSAFALGSVALVTILSFTALYGFFIRNLFFICWEITFVAFCGAFLAFILGLSDNPEKEYYDNANTLKIMSVAKRVVLTVVTLGIYSFIWVYDVCQSLKYLKKDDTDFVGEYLSLCFVPFYGFYWMFVKNNHFFENICAKNNKGDDYKILYSVLFLLQLSWLCYALIQNDINRVGETLLPFTEKKEEKPSVDE
ncbi:MAG: DUF4234 domain-containing protein [Clostridia bacterium]|nr:DUF4234 domain-containing protein [Clostridia bacterium]